MTGFIMRYCSSTKDEAGSDPYLLNMALMEQEKEAKPAAQPVVEKAEDENSAREAQLRENGIAVIDFAYVTKKDKGEASSSSRPPSPPDSGKTTPRVTIAPCPLRLAEFVPPPNYGAVDIRTIFRSSFPQDRNMTFVKGLRIRSILTLVDTEPSSGYTKWIEDGKIKQHKIHIATNKDGQVNTTTDSLCEALIFIMDSSNHPVYIHCNQGKHRTGCVVGCLRKVQRTSMDEIVTEYRNYASPKERVGDLELIKSFDPDCLLEYAKAHGYLDGTHPRLRRLDSGINDVDAFAAALASGALGDDGDDGQEWNSIAISSASSDSSDSPLEMPLFSANMKSGVNIAGETQTLSTDYCDVDMQDAHDLPEAATADSVVSTIDEDAVAASNKKKETPDSQLASAVEVLLKYHAARK